MSGGGRRDVKVVVGGGGWGEGGESAMKGGNGITATLNNSEINNSEHK